MTGESYRRTSPQNNTGDWFAIDGSLQLSELHDLSFDTNAQIAIGGAQDNGSAQQQTSGMTTWVEIDERRRRRRRVATERNCWTVSPLLVHQSLGNFRLDTYDAANARLNTVFPALTVTGGGAAISKGFYSPIKANSIDPNRLVISGDNSFYESARPGQHYQRGSGWPSLQTIPRSERRSCTVESLEE